MKTFYISNNGNIAVDTDNNSCGSLSTEREAISRIYLAKEPMHVVYESGEYKKEIDVEEGDLIIVFYENAFKNRMVVVKNSEWTENLVEYNAEEQKRKEEWAKREADKEACLDPGCNTCEAISR